MSVYRVQSVLSKRRAAGDEGDGFDRLILKLRSSKEALKELSAYFFDRAAVEEAYAKALVKVTKQKRLSDETGSLKSAYESMMGEALRSADDRTAFAKQLRATGDRLMQYKDAQKQMRKNNHALKEKHDKDLGKSLDQLEKYKAKYLKYAEETYTYRNQERNTSLPAKDVASARKRPTRPRRSASSTRNSTAHRSLLITTSSSAGSTPCPSSLQTFHASRSNRTTLSARPCSRTQTSSAPARRSSPTPSPRSQSRSRPSTAPPTLRSGALQTRLARSAHLSSRSLSGLPTASRRSRSRAAARSSSPRPAPAPPQPRSIPSQTPKTSPPQRASTRLRTSPTTTRTTRTTRARSVTSLSLPALTLLTAPPPLPQSRRAPPLPPSARPSSRAQPPPASLTAPSSPVSPLIARRRRSRARSSHPLLLPLLLPLLPLPYRTSTARQLRRSSSRRAGRSTSTRPTSASFMSTTPPARARGQSRCRRRWPHPP
ncbi:uncharacterized protein AMSG_09951 [Thecamonas trahens ATCC 50062]|uniref:FCH domain-containing protein n=1 Tax=Thecamonas trahens ATCC 50062 TaxID=461836 RepID=A0A0L0DPE1_THETB|nr:hypothetical protein AMSG_09951 [Thecamonas trahens ATCC 50062]KNC54167.1 hypothetical protein AMSG_09951 [Thecamonas trahens ATCC 50062]|eukprot:XP_013753985.1 hypothetical protein AMSG_09951 [Thecamonas trahens ATCC 50062]